MAPSPERITVDIEWLRTQSKNWIALGDSMDAIYQGTSSVTAGNAGIIKRSVDSVANIGIFLEAYSDFVTTFQDRMREGVSAFKRIGPTVLTIADSYEAQENQTTSNILGTR